MEHDQSFFNQLKSVQLAYDLPLSAVRVTYRGKLGKWASKQIESCWRYEVVTQETIDYLNEIKKKFCDDNGYEFNHPHMKSWVDHELLRIHAIKGFRC